MLTFTGLAVLIHVLLLLGNEVVILLVLFGSQKTQYLRGVSVWLQGFNFLIGKTWIFPPMVDFNFDCNGS